MGSRTGCAVALLLAAACDGSPPAAAGWARSSGSIALSPDDSRLYVLDRDSRALVVLSPADGGALGRVALGAEPGELTVGEDGTVWVTLRGARSVVRIAPDLSASRGDTGGEPVGLALSPDRRLLYVANMTSRSVSVLDSATLRRTQPDIEVGWAPRAVAALPDGRLYVGDFLAGAVQVVSPARRAVVGRVDLVLPATAECGSGEERTPTEVATMALSPDGQRVYAAHVQSIADFLPRWMRDNGRGSALLQPVAPAVATLETRSDALLVDATDVFDRDPTQNKAPDFPPPLLVTACGPPPGMDAPSAMVVDRKGEWLFIADHNSDAVAVLSARRQMHWSFRLPDRGLATVVRVGARPDGLALSADERVLYVHSAFDYTVSVVEAAGASPTDIRVVRRMTYGVSPLPPAVERGRRLFYSAVDERMTAPELGGVSCSSCHPEGRTDGLNWRTPAGAAASSGAVAMRALNTPALFGAHELEPFHRGAVLETLPALNGRMVESMGGRGLSERDSADLRAYLETVPMPDLPAGDVSRGREVFSTAGCASCHPAPLLSDRRTHGSGSVELGAVGTPSLRGVRATPPYLRDGSAPQLRDVLSATARMPEHRMEGRLDRWRLDALVQYLESL